MKKLNLTLFIIFIFVLICTTGLFSAPPDDLLAPVGKTVTESREDLCPGVVHFHRKTEDPLNINILLIDITQPGVSLKSALPDGTAAGLATVEEMARQQGALAGVNGDYWTHGGIPLNLVVIDSEIVIAPKYRSAFGITREGVPVIDRWTDGWSWQAKVRTDAGDEHEIVMMNSDCNETWLCLYTDRYGMKSKGDSVSPVTEVVCNMEHRVLEVRTDMPGVEIPSGGFVLTGRDSAGQWLKEHFKPGDFARLDLESSRPWQELDQAIGAGPGILKAGQFYQDPIAAMPEGEEFTLPWKTGHYHRRHPRTAVGVSRDKTQVILVTVDGRQPEFSIGVYQKQMADLLLEFGAWDGMDLDSGGSATMVIRGETINHPSDYANPDGTGGKPRQVANSLLLFYAIQTNSKEDPGFVTPEQHELNIRY